ncbi:MAG: response regulator [Gammaproteobacteria bacterium]
MVERHELRVFLVEDAERVRERLLEQLDTVPRVAVVGTATSENIAVAAVPRLACDVVIVDIRLRQGSGLGVLRRLGEASRAWRRTTFIVFSNCSEDGYRRTAARFGAKHFFDKSTGGLALLQTLRELALARTRRHAMACGLQSAADNVSQTRSSTMNTPTNSQNNAAPTTERVSGAAHETIDRMVDSAHPAVDRLAEKAHDAVQRAASAASTASEKVGAQSEHLLEFKDTFAEDCRAYVQANPLKALAYAAVAGFVLTRLLRD